VVAANRPAKYTSGLLISTPGNFLSDKKLTSSINAENNRKQAKDALATLYPLVLALVTLPTASNLSVIYLTLES